MIILNLFTLIHLRIRTSSSCTLLSFLSCWRSNFKRFFWNQILTRNLSVCVNIIFYITWLLWVINFFVIVMISEIWRSLQQLGVIFYQRRRLKFIMAASPTQRFINIILFWLLKAKWFKFRHRFFLFNLIFPNEIHVICSLVNFIRALVCSLINFWELVDFKRLRIL